MPIEVAAIQQRRKTFTATFEADVSLSLDYYPAKASRIDQEAIEQIAADSAGKPSREQRRILAETLIDVLAGWDVTAAGEPFPLDADAMADTFDEAFLGFCVGAVVADASNSKSSGELLSVLGTVTTSQTAGDESSPATKGNRASRRRARSSK